MVEPDDAAGADTTDVVQSEVRDTLPAEPAIPVTLPRSGSQTESDPAPLPSGRPAYAALQFLPELTSPFTEQFGIEEPDRWSAHVQGALVFLPGCTASLVSSDGLAITSSSCLDSAVPDSLGESEATGAFFLADDGPERPLAGLQARILVAAEDVSTRLAEVMSADTLASPEQASALLAERMNPTPGNLDVYVVPGDEGSAIAYTLEHVDDVRLVFAPEPALARFGGDFDAGSYPQYRLDVAFLRLYRDGRPIQTPTYFSWSTSEPRAGAPSFAAGIATRAPGMHRESSQPMPVVSGGRIGGFSFDATEAPALSSFFGLYDRYHSHGGQAPWTLPQQWREVPEGIELEAPMTFAATNEIRDAMLGGAILALNLAYRGTIYDTNHETARLAASAGLRAVVVPASAVSLALESVYGAHELLNELENGRQSD